jgi:chemotaxis protein histidine kinase CheA
MDDNKQQIIHYFIEEAQEHLEVVEQGLLELADTIQDAERVNEMFRAAHSIKGGAAMLGFEGIQQIAHKLEDCFKLLRDHSVPIDTKLESLFLAGYDALKELVDELAASPTAGMRPEVVEKVTANSHANFVELAEYLNELLNTITVDGTSTAEKPAVAVAAVGGNTATIARPTVDIVAVVTDALKQMLVNFKQADTPASRQELDRVCHSLTDVGGDNKAWGELIRSSQTAISNTHAGYNAIAPVVIREIKQAGDLLAAHRGGEIVVSAALVQLASVTAPAPAPAAAAGQVSIPVDARGAAQVILQNFNRQQVTELVVLLHRVISNPKQN